MAVENLGINNENDASVQAGRVLDLDDLLTTGQATAGGS